jgi:hypothetical protein
VELQELKNKQSWRMLGKIVLGYLAIKQVVRELVKTFEGAASQLCRLLYARPRLHSTG